MYNLKYTKYVRMYVCFFYGRTRNMKVFSTLSSYQTVLTISQQKIVDMNGLRKSD